MTIDIWIKVRYNIVKKIGGKGFSSERKEIETFMAQDLNEGKTRIIQELVPGKQITLAHIIANPDVEIYIKLGLDPADEHTGAIGIVTMTPAETAIIAADIATKASGVDLGFVDRFSGTLIITGTVSQVEASVVAVTTYIRNTLGFTVCQITKT